MSNQVSPVPTAVKWIRSPLFLVAFTLLIVVLGSGLTKLEKDTSLDAFVPADSTALALREAVTQQFGLGDPIVIALIGETPDRALDADTLALVREWTRALKAIPGLDPDRVFSLATEEWVESVSDGLISNTLIPEGPLTADDANRVKQGLDALPAYKGILIAKDHSSALLIAELNADAVEAEVYKAVARFVESQTLPEGVSAHVAGQATVSGFLDTYIDQDRSKLIPAAVVLMVILVSVMIRSPLAGLIALVTIAGTLASTLGLMGWMGARYYVITSSLPAVLVCLSVADTIHLLSRARKLESPEQSSGRVMNSTLAHLFKPMAITSLTTSCGFLGVALSTDLPALRDYGYFAAFGVLTAWLCTVCYAPILYRRFRKPSYKTKSNEFFWVKSAAAFLAGRPKTLLAGALAVLLLSLIAASNLVFNYERIRNFAPGSPVHTANQLINQKFNGTYYLDVLLEAPNNSTLITTDAVKQVAELQNWLRQQPEISDSISFLDILDATRRAAVPEITDTLALSADELEQFLFFYEISAKPGDLNQEITPDRRQALVRGYVNTDNFQRVAPVIERLDRYLQQQFNGEVTATINGPLHVLTSWVAPLKTQTVVSALVALALVSLLALILLRSVTGALLCLLPVATAVIMMFGVMASLGIWLDVVTSMFAAISIGLGVDFCLYTVHAVNRGRELGYRGQALANFTYTEVLTPLTLNVIIIVTGFTVLTLSPMPPLSNFGLLIAVSSGVSYIAALLIIPPLASFRKKEAVQFQDMEPAQ